MEAADIKHRYFMLFLLGLSRSSHTPLDIKNLLSFIANLIRSSLLFESSSSMS